LTLSFTLPVLGSHSTRQHAAESLTDTRRGEVLLYAIQVVAI